jgi:hypothetical protein
MNVPQAFVCPTCSAPLEAPNAQGFVTCRFCGTVAEQHVSAAPPPPQAQHVLIRVEPFGSGNVVVPRPAQKTAGAVGAVIVFFVALPVVIGGAVLSSTHAGRSALFVDVASLPTVCTVNQTVNVKGLTYNAPGTAITAQDNCTINITSSNITASTVVRAVGANVQITLNGANIAGTSDAIGLGDNGHLHADANSHITSSASAISGVGANPEVTLDHTKVQGSVAGIDLADNAKIVLIGADVRGATAIRANDNATLQMTGQAIAAGTVAGVVFQSDATITLQNASIQAQGEAIQVGSGSTLNGSGARISGGTSSIDARGGSLANNLAGSTVTGPRLVDGRSTEPPHAAPRPAPVAAPPPFPPARGRRW